MTKFLKRGVVCTGAKFLNHGTSYIYIYIYVCIFGLGKAIHF